jgi:hypothetical protein
VKFYATFKTPDAATFEGFIEQAEREVMRRHDLLDEDHIDPEREDLVDEYNEVAHEMAKFAKQWVNSGETVVLEFDTEAGTCKACKVIR